MPPLYILNPPANPFWDFVNGLEDHPWLQVISNPADSADTPHGGPPGARVESAWASKKNENASDEPKMSEKARGKQASAEDPPEADISTVKPEESKDKDLPFHGRRRFGRDTSDDEARRRCRRERHERPDRHENRERRDRAWGPWGGPPPFSPFFRGGPPHWHDQSARPGPPHGPPHGPGLHGPGPHGPGPHAHGPPPHGPPPHGPPPHGPPPHGPPPHCRGPHRRHSPPHNRPRPDFDLSGFLNRLGERIGVDLTSAAEGLGLASDRFSAGRTTTEVDFEPRADIFENTALYTVHLSLPGAKKSDIGVDYDGEHSVLRITGVVHRPEADEQMLSELVVDGRKRETGVFEKAIRLGTKRDPASIDVAGITAKMSDGVLVVKIPKIERVTGKREVPITADVEAEQPDYEDEYSEKPVLFDAEESSHRDESEVPIKGAISLIDAEVIQKEERQEKPESEKSKKIAEAEKEATSATTTSKAQPEQLPAYSAEAEREEEDWENFSDASGEAEYVKINVN